MKLREINEQPRWTYWVPDSIADWDAPSHWERERLASMEEHLKPGMVLYDVGTEHGWLSAVYGGFVGYENMVLIEPSPEFWPNIRKIWECNGFPEPLAAFQGFIGDQADPLGPGVEAESIWPACSVGPECGAMAYRYLGTDGRLVYLDADHGYPRPIQPAGTLLIGMTRTGATDIEADTLLCGYSLAWQEPFKAAP